MPSVRRTKPWTRKPPLGVRVNWGHPFAQGLVGFWAFQEGSGIPQDIASGNAAVSNNAAWQQSAYGTQLNFTASHSIDLGTSTPWLNIPGPMTAMFAGVMPTGQSDGVVFGFYGAGNTGFGFGINIAATGANSLSYFSTNSGAWKGSNTGLVDGAYGTYGMSVAGTGAGQLTFYKNGLSGGTNTSAVPSSSTGARKLMVSIGGSYARGAMSWIGFWSGAMSPTDHYAIAKDPFAIWQMFQTVQGVWLFPSPAAPASNYFRWSTLCPFSQPVFATIQRKYD